MTIYNKTNEIYNLLKKYIEKSSKYNTKVERYVVDNKYPIVVFENRSSNVEMLTQDRFALDQVYNLSFEITIVATNINNVSSHVICSELEALVYEVMTTYYHIQGGTDAKLVNINTAKATQYVMHFNCKYSARQNKIF